MTSPDPLAPDRVDGAIDRARVAMLPWDDDTPGGGMTAAELEALADAMSDLIVIAERLREAGQAEQA